MHQTFIITLPRWKNFPGTHQIHYLPYHTMGCSTPENVVGTHCFRAVKQQEVKTHCKRRRVVAFRKLCSFATVASLRNLPEEVQDELWYRSTDIERFRNNARKLCREIRRRRLAPHTARGLEVRVDPERQRRKDMTIRGVLHVQRRGSDPRTLAHIYRKCSAWTVVASAMVARRDFFKAYDFATTCDTKVPPMESYPLPFRSKSEKNRDAPGVSSPEAGERRVRRKISDGAE